MIPLLLAVATPAHAAGYSADIELARPTFSGFTLPGFDSASLARPGTLRAGTLLAYERDPLLLYRVDTEVGAVVHNRVLAHVGISSDLTEQVSVRAILPLGGQWGSETERISGDGLGTGDLGFGARYHAFDLGPVGVAGSLDLLLPTGAQDSYLGEGSVRANTSLLVDADLGMLHAQVNVGVNGRPAQVTGEDFTLGSELVTNGALMVDVWPERVRFGAGVLSRTGLAEAWEPGGETPVELMIGGTAEMRPGWALDAGVGRGVAQGYGTTQFRTWAGLTYTRPGKEKLPPPVSLVEPPKPKPPELPEEEIDLTPPPPPPPPPVWKPQELVRVEEQQILIRDPIQFELATNKVLSISEPTLRAISKLMSERPEIAHLVIEGHASDEGNFVYNYQLSIDRALEVYKSLVQAGVHPARMSCRGMGEVQPVQAGESEQARETNRRVVFHISRQLRSDEAFPAELMSPARVPWTGEKATVLPLPERVTQPVPAPEATPAPPPPGDNLSPDVFRDEE